MTDANETEAVRPYRAWKSVLAAVVMYFIDTFVMNQGVLAMMLGIIIVLWWLPQTLYFIVRRQSFREPLTKIAIYSVMSVAAISTNVWSNDQAQERAEKLVVLINQYHADHGSYPNELEDLVPDYIAEIPDAKFAPVSREFYYINIEGRASLFYISLPPFSRPTYSFESQSWFVMD